MDGLHKKNVIITGGSTGIGKEVALLYVKAGHHVVIISRSEGNLKKTTEELRPFAVSGQQTIDYQSGDITDKSSLEKATSAAIQKLGGIDVLILSAGGGPPGYFEEQTEALYRELLELNFFGALYPVQAVYPLMKEQGHGQITIISSGAALMGIFGNAAYGASKFAVRGLGEVLRWEGKPHGITVTMAYPPVTDTPMYHRNKHKKTWENKIIVNKNKAYPVKRVARDIFDGTEKGKTVVTTGFSLFMLHKFGGLFMPLIHWYFDRKIFQERKKRGNSI